MGKSRIEESLMMWGFLGWPRSSNYAVPRFPRRQLSVLDSLGLSCLAGDGRTVLASQ